MLVISIGMGTSGDKETWWWNNEVKDAIGTKKEAKKKWETSGRQEERANKEDRK